MLKINKKYLDFFESYKNVGLLAGGRNTGKSFFGATLCLLNAREGTCNSYAMRKTYETAERDTASLVLAVAKLLFGEEEVAELWRYKISYNQLVFKPTGNYIIFRGVGRQVEDLKSFGDINFIWIDEATNFSSDEMATIIPSIIGRLGESKMLLTSNIPPNKRHWIYRMFLSPERANKYYKGMLSSYKDNPYINQEEVYEQIASLYPKGSSRYIREIEGRIPEFSSEFVINNFNSYSINSKFSNIDFLLSMNAGDLYILAVSFNNKTKEFFVLGEKLIENSAEFFSPFGEFFNNILGRFKDKVFKKPSLLVDMKTYKLLYNNVLKNLINIKVFPVKNVYSFSNLTIFNFKPLDLKIDSLCYTLLNEIDLAEWRIVESLDLEEFKEELVENKVKLFFLNSLRLAKALI